MNGRTKQNEWQGKTNGVAWHLLAFCTYELGRLFHHFIVINVNSSNSR